MLLLLHGTLASLGSRGGLFCFAPGLDTKHFADSIWGMGP